MALIRSKSPLIFSKTFLKPFSSSAIEILQPQENEILDEPFKNPNLSPINSQFSDKFHSLIKDHFRKNPNFDPNPNPNFTIPSLSQSFSQLSNAHSICPEIMTSVIQRCRIVRHGIPFYQALGFFNWAIGERDDVVGDDRWNEPFAEMIDLAGKVKEFDLCWGLIDLMKVLNLQVSVDVFSNVIRRYVRAGMVAEAIFAFDRMEEYGCCPDKLAFSGVVHVLCKKKCVTDAQVFFDRFKDRFGVDVVVYTSLINGWCKVGNISEAERVFREMKMAGIEPNVYSYTIVIDALCRHGQISRAHDVFSEMIEKGCQPNAATFNNLMRVHVKAGKTEKVLQVYNQMKRLGCSPDLITYNFLIEAHCKDGNRDEASKLINQMLAKGSAPSAPSFNPIFHCIAKAKDVNGAHRLFAKMKEVKCEPNTVTYNTLMRMFVESKSTDMVLKLRKEMDDIGVEANENTYKTLIMMFCEMGHWSNAYKYLREMVEEKSLRPSMHLYNKVLSMLIDAGQIKKHEELVEIMVDKGYASRPI